MFFKCCLRISPNVKLHFQRNCIEFALNAKPVRRYIPKNPVQYKLWAFVTSPVFEYTIFAMILINTLSLAMKFYQQPELYTQFLDVLNVIFTVFFTMEFVLKLGAFRFKVNFRPLSKISILFRRLESENFISRLLTQNFK